MVKKDTNQGKREQKILILLISQWLKKDTNQGKSEQKILILLISQW